MINIIKKTLISGNRIIAEIFADDFSEIAKIRNVDGYELFQGSVVYIIKSGELCVMGSDGLWYSEDGEVKS